jgi:hypothetical protein
VEKKHDLCVLPYRLRRVESSKEKKTILLQPTSTKWVWTKRFCGTRIIENKKKKLFAIFPIARQRFNWNQNQKIIWIAKQNFNFLEKQD